MTREDLNPCSEFQVIEEQEYVERPTRSFGLPRAGFRTERSRALDFVPDLVLIPFHGSHHKCRRTRFRGGVAPAKWGRLASTPGSSRTSALQVMGSRSNIPPGPLRRPGIPEAERCAEPRFLAHKFSPHARFVTGQRRSSILPSGGFTRIGCITLFYGDVERFTYLQSLWQRLQSA